MKPGFVSLPCWRELPAEDSRASYLAPLPPAAQESLRQEITR